MHGVPRRKLPAAHAGMELHFLCASAARTPRLYS